MAIHIRAEACYLSAVIQNNGQQMPRHSLMLVSDKLINEATTFSLIPSFLRHQNIYVILHPDGPAMCKVHYVLML